MTRESALLPESFHSANPQQDAGASDGPKLRHTNEQPELPDTRSPTGNPPFMRRCLTAALQLYGLTHRELFAYAVLVSHCRAYVDGEAGSCRMLYLTWATESGVWKPLRSETPEAAKKRVKSAQREMRTIASRLKEVRLLLVRKRIRAADLTVFPPNLTGHGICSIGVNHPYLDRGKSPLSIERGSGKVRTASTAAADVLPAAASQPDNGQQQQQIKSEHRIEGLIGACAARARKLKQPIDEPLERQRLASGEIDVDDLQLQADELQQEIDERQYRRAR